MNYYGGKHLAEAFRTVRKNTLQIAEDIPEDKYAYRAAPGVRTVAEELAHVACASTWPQRLHGVDKKTFVSFEDFGAYVAKVGEMEKGLTSKAAIVEALRKHGEEFARFLEALTAEQLAEQVSFPPPVQPSSRTRFEMLLSVKEHEMHHRAKLMLTERLIGIVPHLTREREARMAAAQGGGAAAPAASSGSRG
ncbi:MAG: DinB family protein [Acidobacteriota bacterium]